MLLRFTVSNHACFAHQAELNMAGVNAEERPVFAGLFGANASGKTRLIDALRLMQRLVVDGTRPGRTLAVQPHRFSPELAHQPSRFEVVVQVDGTLYTYGLVASATRICEEWLFVGPPDGDEVRVFERVTDDSGVRVDFNAARLAPADRIQFIAEGTRHNQLFLTELRERNVTAVDALVAWFEKRLTVIPAGAVYHGLLPRAIDEETFLNKLGSFLNALDTHISGVRLQEQALDGDAVPHEPLADIPDDEGTGFVMLVSGSGPPRTLRREGDGSWVSLSLRTVHRGTDGTDIEMDLSEESAGTQQLVNLFPFLVDCQAPHTFVIDEIDRKLHPVLTAALLKHYRQLRHPEGQLIFSTHDNNLIGAVLSRKAEIWFVEKDAAGKSSLYSLADFNLDGREGLKLDKAYLQGRFGGIPLTHLRRPH